MDQKAIIEEIKTKVSAEMKEELEEQLKPLATTLKEIQDCLIGNQFSDKDNALINKVIAHENRITKIETIKDRSLWVGTTILALAGVGTVKLIDVIKALFIK